MAVEVTLQELYGLCLIFLLNEKIVLDQVSNQLPGTR